MRAFSDLRLNRNAGQTDESFWPSFTDIMMVVVMIFLISSSVLVMRNWELIRQITETAEAERMASETARITIAENATLEERAAALEQQLNIARLQLLRSLEDKARMQRLLEREQARNEALDRERSALENQLVAADQRSQRLAGDIDLLRRQLSQEQQNLAGTRSQLSSSEERLTATGAELAEARAQLAEARRELAQAQGELGAVQQQLLVAQDELQQRSAELGQMQTQFERATEKLSINRAELASAQQEIDRVQQGARLQAEEALRQRSEREEALAAARQQGEITEERLDELRDEYVELKAKYDKLVRPARTTKGKYVVSLRYGAINGERLIHLREPGDAEFRRIADEEQMHRQLVELKERFGGELYIRIIFPEDSQLSYNEAWSFTSQILSQYDYYYQDGDAPKLEEQPGNGDSTAAPAAPAAVE